MHKIKISFCISNIQKKSCQVVPGLFIGKILVKVQVANIYPDYVKGIFHRTVWFH